MSQRKFSRKIHIWFFAALVALAILLPLLCGGCAVREDDDPCSGGTLYYTIKCDGEWKFIKCPPEHLGPWDKHEEGEPCRLFEDWDD